MKTWAASVVVWTPSMVISWVTLRTWRTSRTALATYASLPRRVPGRLHDPSVEAHAASHGEVAVLAVHGQAPDVDPPAVTVHEHVHGALEPAGDPEIARKEIAGPHGNDPKDDPGLGKGVDDLEDRAVAANGDDHIDLRLDAPGRRATQVALAPDDLAIDPPAGRFEPAACLPDCLADLASLAPPAEHECTNHRRAVDGGSPSLEWAGRWSRQSRHRGPVWNAAPTTRSHPVPASRPPRTSVK
jgi:hypothetical protein